MEVFLKWLDRVGEAEPGDLLPKSREDGRCCHDKVPARLRDKVGIARETESVSGSWTDPRLISPDGMSRELAPPGVSGCGVCSVGSKCSGGSMAEVWPVDEALSLKEFSVGDPAIDRARSIMTHHQQLAPTCEWGIFQGPGCHAGSFSAQLRAERPISRILDTGVRGQK